MARIKNFVLTIAILLTAGRYSYQSAYGWIAVVRTNELFTVGTVEGSEKIPLHNCPSYRRDYTGDTDISIDAIAF